MKRDIITISDSEAVAVPRIIRIEDNGSVIVPPEVRMTIYEIANLLEIFHQTAKRHIRAIEKSGIADGDYSMTCTVEGLKVYPEYYGLDMVMAVAFRVSTYQAKIFRRWVIRKASKSNMTRTILLPIPKMESN